MLETIKLLQRLKALDIHPYLDGNKLRVRDTNKRLTRELRSQIRANKSTILDLLSGQQNKSVESIYGLSPMQSGMLFHSQLAPDNGTYIEHTLFHVDDPRFDASRFIQAIQTVIDHHDSLRAAFRSHDGSEAVQMIYERAILPVTVLDWREIPDEEYQKRFSNLVEEDRLTDFDFSQAPLLRLTVIERSQNGYERKGNAYDLLFTYHHILMDRWSVDLFWSEVLRSYTGQPLPKATPYQSYIHYLRQQQDNASFWQDYLSGFYGPTPLPGVTTSTQKQGQLGGMTQTFSFEATQQLTTFAREQGLTVNTLFQAAWAVLLARYTRESDVVFGMVTSGRAAPIRGIESILGLFINTLPFRVQLDAELTGSALLQQVAQSQLEIQQREHTPLVDVQQWSEVPAGSGLFDSLLLFQNTPQTAKVATNQFDLRRGWVQPGDTGYPLVAVVAQGESATLVLGYDTARYDEHTASRVLTHWQQLVMGMVSHPNQPVLQLPMLTDAEYHQIVHEWNDTAVDFGDPQTIHALFEQQVERTPEAIAVIFGDQQLTYAELNARANQLAHHLISFGVQAETLVAVAMERSPEMVVSLLAVLKAGGAYVPIDPTYPSERIGYMLTDSAAPILLTQSHLGFSVDSEHVMAVDKLGAIDAQSTLNPQTRTWPEQLAYVIYTSGSTGQPKGVMIQHNQVLAMLSAYEQIAPLARQMCGTSVCSYNFDVSVWEFFSMLCFGGTLHILTIETYGHAKSMVNYLSIHAITSAYLPPMLLTQIALAYERTQTPITLKRILVGVEPIGQRVLQRFRNLSPDLKIINGYGPTECTICSSFYEFNVAVEPERRTPIGKPLANYQIYLCDANLQPVPIGVSGEILIGGAGVGRGYLNRPELTVDRFIVNPFTQTPHGAGQLYKTGDLARWLPDGNIEFIGRTDFQVKIRGFRIELGEIENVLLTQDGVREAVVLARAVRSDKRLVAYIVGDADSDTLRVKLAQRLPDYMVPSAFVTLIKMPLTPNGKLDRRALPAPDYVDVQTAYVPPRNALERQVAEIWVSVLGVEQVGIYDDFFALGGHSLLATQVISQVRAQLDLEVPLKSLFEASQLAAFAQHISQWQTSASAIIRRVPRDGRLPLSFAQQRLWFLDQLEPDSAFYNIPTLIRLEGELNVVALEQSFAYLIARHESLRTTFDVIECAASAARKRAGGTVRGGKPVQVIHPPNSALSVRTVSTEQEALRHGQVVATTPFNLREGPLLRVELLKITEHDYLLALNMHHIISDGWSIGVLVKELTHAYTAYAQQNVPTLPELPIQYADFAVWQREYLSGDTLDAQLSFWREQLRGAPARLELPTNRPRPPVQSYRGAHYRFHLNEELTAKLNELAQSHDATLFMVLLSAFNVLLSRYSRQTDIVVGTPIANRNRAEIEGLIGFFVNTLALRTELDDNPTFSALLNRVRQTTLAAYEHQDLPFEQLVDELQLERTLSYTPLFQVMLVLQNAQMGTLGLTGVRATPHATEFPFAKFDLTLYLMEDDEGLRGVLEYNSDLFDKPTIGSMANHFTVLLNSIVSQPDQPVLELPMLPLAEYEQIVHEFNECAVNFGEPETIHALFEQQVERRPDAIALVFASQQLTYYELNARANQLAHHLIELGVGPDVLVGICMERSLSMLVGVLGILKAGGAYVPLDPSYPSTRLRFMLQDANLSLLLTVDQVAQKLPENEATMVNLADIPARDETQNHNPASKSASDNLAYVLYTSGSTGKPKAVAQTHRTIWNLVSWQQQESDGSGRTLQFAPMNFDISVQEFFTTLCVGGTLVLISEEVRRDPFALMDYLKAQSIRRLFIPFTPLQQLAEVAKGNIPTTLREVIQCGEALQITTAIANWFRDSQCVLYNHYGPTESHVVTTYRLVDDVSQWSIWPSIGAPVANTELYILDAQLQPVPIGVPGQLYIAGVQVARCYLNRPELTQERFIPNPFDVQGNLGPLYKTGDLCRWLPDGNIEFMGRTDFQVKIRGFRIELGEIENALLREEGVREAVVLAREDGAMRRDKRLVAYFVGNADSQTLRQHLVQRLPDYMIPSAFVELEAMPVTPNGKLDRRALPAPDYVDAQTEFVAPRNTLEQQLANIWASVLGLDKVGIHDNFFALGGHSLLATQVASRIRTQLKVALPLKNLFNTSDLADLAALISAFKRAANRNPKTKGRKRGVL